MMKSKKGISALISVLVIIVLAVGIGSYFLLFKSDSLPPSCPEGNSIAPNTLKCRDSDFGSVTYRIGIVTNKFDKKTDSCLSDKDLREYKCDCVTGEIKYIDVDCSQNFDSNSCRGGI